ncbi:hypothetical protein NQZ68_003900 [Dissostichus eleginoides]|nr:hypothetical protein NQZ68_003900 [Dissostichus eleginoides]
MVEKRENSLWLFNQPVVALGVPLAYCTSAWSHLTDRTTRCTEKVFWFVWTRQIATIHCGHSEVYTMQPPGSVHAEKAVSLVPGVTFIFSVLLA